MEITDIFSLIMGFMVVVLQSHLLQVLLPDIPLLKASFFPVNCVMCTWCISEVPGIIILCDLKGAM